MKSAKSKNPLKKKEKRIDLMKITPTHQVVLAGIFVLLIFLAAVLSSVPKNNQSRQAAAPVVTADKDEMRSGTQVARVSITRSGDTQQTAVGLNTNGNVAIQPPAATTAVSPVGTPSGPNGMRLTSTTTNPAAKGSDNTGIVLSAGNRVQFKINNFKKLAVQPLKFKVLDERGMELSPEYLQTVQEHKIHFYVVSANLREFQHLFPDYDNGMWNVSANLPNPGTYYAYVDISPVKGNPVVLRSELTVREPTKTDAIKYPGLTPNKVAISGDISAVLNLIGIGLGAENILSWSLTRDGNDAGGFSPYVGSFGNVTILRQGDLNIFLKARPLPVADENKGMFDFASAFIKAGRYTAFAEFKVNGKLLVFPITFEM